MKNSKENVKKKTPRWAPGGMPQIARRRRGEHTKKNSPPAFQKEKKSIQRYNMGVIFATNDIYVNSPLKKRR